MKHILVMTAVLLGSAFGAQAQEADIRKTIDGQLEAFQADDFATAFTYASPELQRLFQSPENFRMMVTRGYPMVWRPGSVRYLELADVDGIYRQKLMVTDQAGKTFILDYSMTQTEAGWKISGVQVLENPGANV